MAKKKKDISHLSDEELLFLITYEKQDPYAELFERYRPMYTRLARKYYHTYLELDDLIQEAWIVITKSVHIFDDSQGATLGQFLKRSINNEYQNLLRKDTSIKRRIDKYAMSLDAIAESSGDSIYKVMDNQQMARNDTLMSPSDKMMVNDMFERYSKKLSKFETECLELYIEQMPYEKIAEAIDEPESRVVNAIDRCRVKLKKFIKEDHARYN